MLISKLLCVALLSVLIKWVWWDHLSEHLLHENGFRPEPDKLGAGSGGKVF